jgi:hypothetical protein
VRIRKGSLTERVHHLGRHGESRDKNQRPED